MAKKKKRRSRRGGGGGGPRIASGKDKAYIFAGAGLYGYLSHHVELFESLPVAKALGAPITHGIILHYAAGASSGDLRRWLDLASVGALSVGGYFLGVTKGDLEKAAAMSGEHMMGQDDDDDDDEIDDDMRGDDLYIEGDFDEDDDDEVEGDYDDDDDEDDEDVEGHAYEGDDEMDDEYEEEAA